MPNKTCRRSIVSCMPGANRCRNGLPSPVRKRGASSRPFRVVGRFGVLVPFTGTFFFTFFFVVMFVVLFFRQVDHFVVKSMTMQRGHVQG